MSLTSFQVRLLLLVLGSLLWELLRKVADKSLWYMQGQIVGQGIVLDECVCACLRRYKK